MASGGSFVSAVESRPMVGGDGPHSYNKNSHLQKTLANLVKEPVYGGIMDNLDFKNLCFDSSSTFRIADFGCSTGPNSFFAAENIIEAVKHKYHSQIQNSQPLEFQVFFNDLTDNDFNTLFKTLQPCQKYFAAGVPGSFHGRLFPKSSLQVAYSFNALHWLSKVPKEIVDKKSLAWNKGSICCTGLVKEVTNAYSAQFRNDMNSFLDARAEEIFGGGLMEILMAGLPEGVLLLQTGVGADYGFIASSLTDMTKTGVISEEQVDSFNLPIYFSSAKEVEEIVKRNGNFSVERMEELNPLKAMKTTPEFFLSHNRAALGGVLAQHFGENILDEVFKCYGNKLRDNFHFIDEASHETIHIFLLLKRNIS